MERKNHIPTQPVPHSPICHPTTYTAIYSNSYPKERIHTPNSPSIYLASHPLIQPVIYTSTHPPMDPHPAPSHPVHQPFTVCIDMEMALQLPSPAWVLTPVLKAPLVLGPRGHLNTCHMLGFVFVTH